MKIEFAFGAVIKRRRIALGISQEKLAKRTNQYGPDVCDHEKGRHLPSLNALIAYAGALDCTLLELVAEAQRRSDPASELVYKPAHERDSAE